MEKFHFDDGNTAADIKESDGKFIVSVEMPEDGKFTTGFSSYKDARAFIMSNDFTDGKCPVPL